jgi:REP element-mobilizing transposase RayT
MNDRPDYLPRLPREYHQGDAVVHWTQTTFDRARGWLDADFHARFRELMLHVAAREGLFCPAYCPMPDHIHHVWMGLRLDSNQRTGMAFLRTHLEPALAQHRFQPQAEDNVLRQQERKHSAFARACVYILDNPVKAGLAERPQDWPRSGAVVPGYPKLHPLDEDFWPTFWKLYEQFRAPDAGNIKRPPFRLAGADVRRLAFRTGKNTGSPPHVGACKESRRLPLLRPPGEAEFFEQGRAPEPKRAVARRAGQPVAVR